MAAAFPPRSALLPLLASFNYSRPPLFALMMERTSTVQEREQARGRALLVKMDQAEGEHEHGGPQSPEPEGERQCGLLLLVAISAGSPVGTVVPL